jgi:hypothetical protein
MVFMIQKLIPAKEWLGVILASGIVGTAVMTVFMYILGLFTTRVLQVAKTLGTMITCQTEQDGGLSDSILALFVGVVANYAVGILFAYGYYLLWSNGVGEPGFWNGMLLGLMSGVFAVAFWFTFFAVHPFPPRIELQDYMATLFLAHFVFASVTVAFFSFLAGKVGVIQGLLATPPTVFLS